MSQQIGNLSAKELIRKAKHVREAENRSKNWESKAEIGNEQIWANAHETRESL